MSQRIGRVERQTRETQIRVEVNLDGSGAHEIATGIGFFDHMLTAVAVHGRLDLAVAATGDLAVSEHHTIEDVGIVLGLAVAHAVGDKRGIHRYGHAYIPMDEALARVVLDLSGRAYAHVELPFRPSLGSKAFDYALVSEFLWGFARAAACTLHADGLRSENNHHLCEATFKAFARALHLATRFDPALAGALPSTKGSFDG